MSTAFQDITGPAGPLGPPGPSGPTGPSTAFLAESHVLTNDAYNTTAEVNMLAYTIPAGLLKAGDRLRIKLLINCIQNSVAVQYWHRLRIAGVQAGAISYTPQVTANQRQASEEFWEIQMRTLTDIYYYAHILSSSPGTTIGVDSSSFPTAVASLTQSQLLGSSSSFNFTGATLLQVTAQPNQARGDSDHQVWGWTIERIPS